MDALHAIAEEANQEGQIGVYLHSEAVWDPRQTVRGLPTVGPNSGIRMSLELLVAPVTTRFPWSPPGVVWTKHAFQLTT